MKKKNLPLTLLTIFILSIYACDSDPCNEGYTQVNDNGATFCLPDYIAGIENASEYGNMLYHSEYGIIKLNKGKWTNEIGENITDLLKAEY
jgi:hypothetical protein